MKAVFCIAVIFFFSFCSLSQDYLDILKTDYAVGSEAQFEDEASATRLQEFNVDFTLPIPLNDKVTFLTGAIYENINASFQPKTSSFSVSAITLKVGVNVKHTNKWSATYMTLPKLASDFNRFHTKDFQFGAAALFKYRRSAYFNYKFGLYTNTERFSQILVPMFGFYYQHPKDKLEVKILLPLSGDISYRFSEKSRVGANFKGQVRSYNLNTDHFPASNSYLSRSANDLYAYIQHQLTNGIHLQVGVGRSLGRSYRVYNESISFAIPLVSFNDNRQQLNTDFQDSWLIKLSAFYRLDLEK